MKKLLEFFFLWLAGGSIYYSIELLFRGFSHWSMFVLGGLVLCFAAFQGLFMHWSEPLWKQVLRCTVLVTSLEFITGIIVNKWLRLQVWDYTDQPFQLWGQICVPFMILFSGLSVAAIFLGGYLLFWVFKEEKPHFFVL